MSFVNWLGVVAAIIGTVSFTAGRLEHIRSQHTVRRFETQIDHLTREFDIKIDHLTREFDIKVDDLKKALRSLRDMADSVIWETQVLPGESIPTRLTQLEKSVHTVAAMRTLASNYVGGDEDYRSIEFGELIRRKVVWSQDRIDRLETTSEVREVWANDPRPGA